MKPFNKKWIVRFGLPLVVAVCVFIFVNNTAPEYSLSVQSVPEFTGEPYVVLNNNQPEFTEDELIAESYEFYSQLDRLGRCGYAMACIGYDLMPTEERGSIGQVKPSGWQLVKYDFHYAKV